MDFSTKEVVIGIIGIAVYIFNHFKNSWATKKQKELEQEQRESAALKLAQDSKKQAEDIAATLRQELVTAAERLAAETARQIHEREHREAEDKARIEHARSIEVMEDIDKKAKHTSKAIIRRFRAQRAYVIHWSNGTETAAGLHLMKITFKHEVVEDFSVEPISRYFREKHLPEMFFGPMKKALTGSEYYLNDSAELDINDPYCKSYRDWLESYKVRSTIWVPLKSSTGNVIAILVLHWHAKPHLSDIEISLIRDMKGEIEDFYKPLKKTLTPSGSTRAIL